MADMSASDVALLSRGNNDMFGGEGGFFWVFALLLLYNGGFGGGYGYGANALTQADLAASQNAQTNQFTLQNIQSQLNDMNNTNMINAIQGFNTVNQNIQNQTNVLSNQIQGLSAQLNECCCSIKTQMLQDRLDEAERRNVVLQNSIDNANQSQYILGQLGRFVAWAGSGSAAASAVSGS
jgi:hypothetical protein